MLHTRQIDQPALFLLGALTLGLFLWRWHVSRRSISYIPGPKASWLYGNVKDYYNQKNAGDMDYQFLKQYGRVWRMRSPLGTDILTLADPKALHHCFHKAADLYDTRVESSVLSLMILGRGIVWAHGTTHERQRRIMAPAFSHAQIRSFLPAFRAGAAKLTQKWKDDFLADSFDGGIALPVHEWMSRMALDTLGETAFDYNFGAVDDQENELANAFHTIFSLTNIYPQKWHQIFMRLWYFLPESLLDLMEYIPAAAHSHFRSCRSVIDKAAQQLIDEKREALLEESGSSRDIFTVLVRANGSSNPQSRLSDEELIGQLGSLVLAGHVSTSATLSWVLYELANHQDYQTKMREEILAARIQLRERGVEDFGVEDLENMPLATSCVKETLRYDSPASQLTRTAMADDVIPLEHPVRTTSGQYVTEIPIARGQQIFIPVCTYQRLPEVWGADADVWNPMRFIEGSVDKELKIGLYSNLLSFAAGSRGCLGWRFATLEILATIVELLENFRFEPTEETAEVIRAPTTIMCPWTAGKEREGPQLWLKVIPLR